MHRRRTRAFPCRAASSSADVQFAVMLVKSGPRLPEAHWITLMRDQSFTDNLHYFAWRMVIKYVLTPVFVSELDRRSSYHL